MADRFDAEVAAHSADSIQREVFGTRLGFILAAVGSAVGLGNMWRFSYTASEGGGAAFVFLYVILTLVVGIPIMLAEFAAGRKSRRSAFGALRAAGGPKWLPVAFLYVASGFLILSYYSVIAGWVFRYALESIAVGFPADAGAHFEAIATGPQAMAFHLLFMIITVAIVMGGIEKGIERTSSILMPALFMILVGLAAWAFTLDGAGAGYAAYLKPVWGDMLNGSTFASAAAQAFFSLSLGMGAMLTFASYLSRDENLSREAAVISFADFGVAFIAGLVVFPIVFALGLQGAVSESTVGALFIALPGAFAEMTGGRIVGALFFLALLVGALTSAISLLEVVVASLIDEFEMPRKKAALGAGALIALVGLASASSLDTLGLIDAIAGELFLVVGGLGIALLVGYRMKGAREELERGASPLFRKVIPVVVFFLRYIVPPIVVFVIWDRTLNVIGVIRTTFGGG
ncbi:MAG: sodium-dependent transporter [Longimicrobiales bacterium]|nr:sodium-dependent transporter [Longimicrobiales bacterium]